MLRIVNPHDELTAARIVELLEPATPWNRALWTLSLSLTLKEFLEACKAQRDGTLHEKSVARLGSIAMKLAGTDPAATDEERRLLNTALKQSPRYQGAAYHQIAELLTRIDGDYLSRWAVELNNQQPERAARSVASHLLDLGFSDEFLCAWWRKHLFESPINMTLAEICERAHCDLAQRPERQFEALVAFKTTPRLPNGYPAGWLTSRLLISWLKEHRFDVAGVRPSGGLILPVMAKDPVTASRVAAARLDQYISRTAVATGEALQPWPTIWVCDDGGESKVVTMAPSNRGVRVKVLSRENLIFSKSDDVVGAAIELLAHLESSSPSAAIAGGWAAVEALLADPGDRSEAAENLAWIVAASFPRAELTALSYKAERDSLQIRSLLSGIHENRERALKIAEEIERGGNLGLRKPADRAGLRRVQKILRTPSTCLVDVQSHVAAVFHRLYRQRNLILHGGQTNGVALRGSLRTAAKLVGAGMDRIAHGWYVKHEMRPLELAAIARIGIQLLPAGSPRACVEILGD